ncbi:NADH dehydrogenase subunit 3 (mitochondrion) [Aphidius gifuensis]|uniref:NADH-ubiquinone oxidoreductase chain 3 n=2 Tax=Aphidius gifuensis TaxID=684658 RepID=A0A7S8CU29_APHGI|nr:NADH dehydrogenase subunit 3 [Aphidius gifuensis]QPC56176.1 NADH dehydrogenase subunit 3 [Aphidius gifuensis]WLE65021.1 NADH dehydrogenase subunit 3 [Aphidius gifuensis]WLE65034.1 NADH dehydrogenase subunit 3 [Aphidius gifuensis]WLE65047.1 NADH dehydrogenase subunit 3 [Aphidius gifuensis]WLE65060.1 NADH dehydrogenase subunit 3 [Aphidius gifuensis]
MIFMSLMFIMMILFISMILIFINYLLSKKENQDREKISSFECGFDVLSSSRLPFSIHFFMIAILFLVFDVEVVFLIPLINSFIYLNLFEWIYMSLIILLILYWGLEFEKFEGSLKWVL